MYYPTHLFVLVCLAAVGLLAFYYVSEFRGGKK